MIFKVDYQNKKKMWIILTENSIIEVSEVQPRYLLEYKESGCLQREQPLNEIIYLHLVRARNNELVAPLSIIINSGLGSNNKTCLLQRVKTTHKYENPIGVLEIRLARIKEDLGGIYIRSKER